MLLYRILAVSFKHYMFIVLGNYEYTVVINSTAIKSKPNNGPVKVLPIVTKLLAHKMF